MYLEHKKLALGIGLGGIALLASFDMLGTSPFRAKPVTSTPTPAVTPSAFSIATRPIDFVFGGDVMLGRTVGYLAQKRSDYSYPFRDIATEFASSDANSVNLESPIFAGCIPSASASMRFCAQPSFAQTMAGVGIKVVSFANNHMMDDGVQGVRDTNGLLSGAGVNVVNDASSTIETVAGRRVGFVSFNMTWNNVSDAQVEKLIADTKSKSDFVIVNFHWGQEYQTAPDTDQVRIGHLAIDAGADVVIGTHPHVLEPVEQYKGKYIFYSLGNLVFDQFWSEATREGALVRLHWYPDSGAIMYDIVPLYIAGDGAPHILDRDATTTARIMQALKPTL